MNIYDKDWLPAMLMEQMVLGFILAIISFFILGPMFQYLLNLSFHGVSYSWTAFPILLIPYGYCIETAIKRIRFKMQSNATMKGENK